MKKTLIASILMLVLSLFLVFCDDESDSGYYMKFKLDGVSYNFTKGCDDMETAFYSDNESFPALWGVKVQDDESDYLIIDLESTGTGNFSTLLESASFTLYIEDNYIEVDSGTVDVTSYESGGTVEGTFSGSTIDSGDLTDGSFKVPTCTGCDPRD